MRAASEGPQQGPGEIRANVGPTGFNLADDVFIPNYSKPPPRGPYRVLHHHGVQATRPQDLLDTLSSGGPRSSPKDPEGLGGRGGVGGRG